MSGTTSIKIAGPVSYSDANALGREMYTSGEFLRSMRKTDHATQFAVYLKTITASAVQVSIPFGMMESEPQLTDVEHAEIRQRNRERVGIARLAPPPTTPTPRARTTPPPLPKATRDPTNAAEY